MDVEKFLEEIKTRPVNHKGKLAMWHEDILKLRNAGCTYAQIVEYLELKDVKVSISAVQSFCSKHFNSNKVTAQNNTKSQKETIAQAITEIPSELPATTSESVEAEVSEDMILVRKVDKRSL